MKTQQIADALVKSPKGITPERLAKAKALCVRARRPVEQFEEVLATVMSSRGVFIHPKAIEEAHQIRMAGLQKSLTMMQSLPEGDKTRDKKERERALTYLSGAIEQERVTHQQWREKHA